jgi:NTP pyrophosphatase (non-canonical NTP hydrolase)
MTFNEYQAIAQQTAQYPKQNNLGLFYAFMGLANESGECVGKIKKLIRDHDSVQQGLEQKQDAIIDELGDVLWYLSACADELGVSLEEIAKRNNAKLLDRLERNKIKGSGDKR